MITITDLKQLISNCIYLENEALKDLQDSCDVSASDYADAEERLVLHGERRARFEKTLADEEALFDAHLAELDAYDLANFNADCR